jgi:ABC-type transport system involved in multi-copper enzyme maturation permease subunit
MLRVVIQVSMILAVPLMAITLYVRPDMAAWYIGYVVLFNMLVGPVFSAGAVTSERERETLDLLLVTTLSPGQILWAKLISGLRVSSVLTLFLLWPLLLACIMVSYYWTNLPIVAAYLVIVGLSALTTATIALFCSTLVRKTSTSLMTAYLVIVVLFLTPLAVNFFAQTFFGNTATAGWLDQFTFTSPFAAARALTIDLQLADRPAAINNWGIFFSFAAFYATANLLLIWGMLRLFAIRWRVSE